MRYDPKKQALKICTDNSMAALVTPFLSRVIILSHEHQLCTHTNTKVQGRGLEVMTDDCLVPGVGSPS